MARIMRVNQIKALRGYKAPRVIAGRPSIIAPNQLQREFTVDRPDYGWVTDITYSAPSLRKLLWKMLSGLEHVWNASRTTLEETNWMPALLLWESMSRSGGDLLHIGRVTEPAGNGM